MVEAPSPKPQAQGGDAHDRTRVLILGAGGRDFHNFNVRYRDDPRSEVVGFTATQIPDLEGRVYPAQLAGPLYPSGIPIYAEEELPALIGALGVDDVVFAYSDVSHEHVMHVASIALAAGANFVMLGPDATMLQVAVPVVSIAAVRTGAGKSQTTRRVAAILRQRGRRVAVIRHPMAYGDLLRQRVQRFATLDDLDAAGVTIEEREEYEPHLQSGSVVFAGVDYAAVVHAAEAEADVIVWDGGNNDFPFVRSDLRIVVADPLRAGHELTYHPGETNTRMADVVVINKVDISRPNDVERVRVNVRRVNPAATIVEAASPVQVEGGEQITGRRVLVVEDGPTLTHGGMSFGAGVAAARQFGAAEIVDARAYAVGSLREVYRDYPHLEAVLPAMGYGAAQIHELEETINAADCDLVVIGTPVDLRRIMMLTHPAVRVRYELQELTRPTLDDIVGEWLEANDGTAR